MTSCAGYHFQGRSEHLRRALEHPPDPSVLAVSDLGRVSPADEWVGRWVVTASDGLFRCGDRRREHVDIAGGEDVRAAGEVWFERDGKKSRVAKITNRSIGYRIPLPESYEAVSAAFAKIGLEHAAGAYDEAYVGASCAEHGLQVLKLGDPLACKVCFARAESVHVEE